ncbi:MAG: CPBP family intramembrane metalloprotease [Firmicutes bacterium]|nr:CPBP family intramembrane metalloprotease [Bacillota bacterium]
MKLKEEFKKDFAGMRQTDKNLNIVIVFTTIVLFLYCYMASFSAYYKFFDGSADIDFWAYIYHNATPIILFFVFGILLIKFVMKDKLRNYGLGLGKYKTGLIICAAATPILIGLGFLTAFSDFEMVLTYPLTKYVYFAPIGLVVLYYATYVCYYIGWEFLFRGLGFFSFERKLGVLTAILITTALSVLIHTSIGGFGKPMLETAGAIAGGLLFGYAAYKTRSIWYSVYLHFVMGFALDMAIIILNG